MKALKILATGFLILILHPCFSEDLELLMADINAIKSNIQQNKNSSPVLSNSFEKLQDYLPGLKNCVKEQDKKIKQINSSLKVLKDTQSNPQLILKKEQELNHFKQVNDHKIFCNYLIMDIDKTIQNIKSDFFNILLKSFTKKYPNIIETFREGIRLNISYLSMPYLIENLYQRNKLFKVEKSQFLWLTLIIFLSLLNLFKVRIFNKTIHLNIKKLILIGILITCVAPIRYILLQTLYIKYNEYLLLFYTRPLIYLVSISCAIYVYTCYKKEFVKSDFAWGVITYICSFLLNFLSFKFISLEIQYADAAQIVQIKYFILITQQLLLSFIVKAIYMRFLDIQFFKYPLSLFILGLNSMLFLVGLYGYIDLAINLNYILLIDSIIIFWSKIFTNLKSSIITKLSQPQLGFHKYLKKNFSFNTGKIIFSIKTSVYSIYFFSLLILFTTFIFETFWIIPITSVETFYKFLFLNYAISIGGYNFRLNDILLGIFSLFFLSTLNFAISAYVAKKSSNIPIFQKKIAQTLSWVGYLISIITALKLSGLVLENLFVIAGGLFLGLAFAAKNIFSSLFGSIIIFINRPFDVGDFIEFQNIKGFVKKIALFEVTIETLDKNIVHIPNKSIEYSTLENFTFQHKTQHKVHINYLINQFNLNKETKLLKQLKEIIQNNPDVIINQKNPIEILFSPEGKTKDSYNLEIIFNMKNLRKLPQSINTINRSILKEFVHLKIDGLFVSSKHPLSSN